jgi:di-heme oxidoreductase (putative peroxidase)
MSSGAFVRQVENSHFTAFRKSVVSAAFLFAVSFATVTLGQFPPHDPGVRSGTVDSGQPLSSLPQTSGSYYDFFTNGLARFQEMDGVPNGLGPRFNTNQCASCHAQPAVGGSSPTTSAFPFLGPNPEVQFANAQNALPSFISPDGPVCEARFKFFLDRSGSLSASPDGGVHDLFVITGRSDANGCILKQPDFAHNLALNNIIFRIPTPVFGAGLIENIPDEAILANMHSNGQQKEALGISGHPNRDGNDGAIARFGWKAQNKSLEIFAGEAYNVEMGVTNELFQNERASPDEAQYGGLPASCRFNPTPEDGTNPGVSPDSGVPSDVVQFAMFMRLLAPPSPSATNPGGSQSIANGSRVFGAIGCAMCHTPTLATGTSKITPGLNQVNANLFSDLLVHHMGSNLADGVSQGGAGPDEFRSAPLWGLGQRIFFLHDGRTSDLLDAIREHASQSSEANTVISNFRQLSPQQKQDLLNFLRSL